MAIKGVLFDFDGTLTQAGSLDFSALRERIGCPKTQPVLEFIDSLHSAGDRENARRVLDTFEVEAARRSYPNEGAEELIDFLHAEGVKLAIITRNSARSVLLAFQNFRHIDASAFDVILTRDDAPLPKPSPEAVLEAARRIGLRPDQVLMVGDFTFDIEAGHAAGARTAFLTNGAAALHSAVAPEFTISRLSELRKILELLTPLPIGKLPNRFLGRLLERLDPRDPSLIVAPGVGEDVAAVGIESQEVLVLKSDPITFTADQAGTYAVMVNTNDVATSGAVPRWLLTSLLFPPDTCVADIERVMLELDEAARSQGLTLCGGHTEVTDAVTRPVVVGHVAGTVSRKGLILKRNMRRGDHLLITKAIAVEGTSILARELPGRLQSLGAGPEEIRRCRDLLTEPGISIVREARIAAESGKVTAMHDVTEGGLSTALEEFSVAGQHRFLVHRDRIPILSETARFCSLLNADPLGLIASGSLLITCDGSASVELAQAIRRAGIDATVIGEVLEEGHGIEARNARGEIVRWPGFAVDELARIMESAGDGDNSGREISSPRQTQFRRARGRNP